MKFRLSWWQFGSLSWCRINSVDESVMNSQLKTLWSRFLLWKKDFLISGRDSRITEVRGARQREREVERASPRISPGLLALVLLRAASAPPPPLRLICQSGFVAAIQGPPRFAHRPRGPLESLQPPIWGQSPAGHGHPLKSFKGAQI